MAAGLSLAKWCVLSVAAPNCPMISNEAGCQRKTHKHHQLSVACTMPPRKRRRGWRMPAAVIKEQKRHFGSTCPSALLPQFEQGAVPTTSSSTQLVALPVLCSNLILRSRPIHQLVLVNQEEEQEQMTMLQSLMRPHQGRLQRGAISVRLSRTRTPPSSPTLRNCTQGPSKGDRKTKTWSR